MHHPTIKDLNLDLTQWQPIVEERGMVNWLVKNPSDQELARARLMPLAAINKLEEVRVRVGCDSMTIYPLVMRHIFLCSCGSSSPRPPWMSSRVHPLWTWRLRPWPLGRYMTVGADPSCMLVNQWAIRTLLHLPQVRERPSIPERLQATGQTGGRL